MLNKLCKQIKKKNVLSQKHVSENHKKSIVSEGSAT